MNIVLIDPSEMQHSRVCLTDGRADHIRKVLRLKKGDTLRAGLINGPIGVATLSGISAEEVELTCEWLGDEPPAQKVDIMLALPRPKVMKRLWAPLASLGVGRIILVNAWKVERNYFDTHVLEESFYRNRLIEGLQQAGDTRVPDVRIFRSFRKFIEDDLDELYPAALRLVADPSGEQSIHAITAAKEPSRVLLAIGPEGGWIPRELDSLTSRAFSPVGMGSRILRTDTACIALLSLVHDAIKAGR